MPNDTTEPEPLSPALEAAVARLEPEIASRDTRLAVIALGGLAQPEKMEELGLGPEHLVEVFTKTHAVDHFYSSTDLLEGRTLVNTFMNQTRVLHVLPALTQDPGMFELALSNSRDINTPSPIGTLGHVLARKGTVEQLDIALRYGLDPTALSPTGARMADVAEAADRPEMAQAMREAARTWEQANGVAPHASTASTNPIDMAVADGATMGLTRAEVLAMGLIEAANNGKMGKMEELFAAGAETNSRIRLGLFDGKVSLEDPEAQTTALHIAAMVTTMPKDSLAALCERSPNINELVGDVTPLMNAAVLDTGRNVAVLVAAKADIHVRNSAGYTALSIAREAGNEEGVQVLEQSKRDALRERTQALAKEALSARTAPRQAPGDRGDSR